MNTDWSLIDFSRVEVVSYDLGYTVVGLSAKQVAKLIKDCFDCPYVSLMRVHLADHAMRRDVMVSGTKEQREQTAHYADALCQLLDYLHPHFVEEFATTEQLIAFRDECREYHDTKNFFDQIYHDALAAIQFLEHHGVRKIVISNAQGTLDRDLRMFGLYRYFEHILDSGAEGVAKPDPEIFVRAIDRAAVIAEHVLHIGDNPHADITGSLAVGMQAALYDPTGMFPDAHGKAPQFRSHLDLAERLVAARS